MIEHPLYRLLLKKNYEEKVIENLKSAIHIKARACEPKSVAQLRLFEKKMANLIHELFLTDAIDISK